MKSEHVNPFVDGTINTFEMMCGVVPKRNGKLSVLSGMIETFDLIGVIGLSGSIKGACLLTMPVDTGMKCVTSFLGEEVQEVNADLLDAYGELLNIIAGAAAAKLTGMRVNLALPTVLIGKDQHLSSKSKAPWVVIPMKFDDWGEFNIEVSMEEI